MRLAIIGNIIAFCYVHFLTFAIVFISYHISKADMFRSFEIEISVIFSSLVVAGWVVVFLFHKKYVLCNSPSSHSQNILVVAFYPVTRLVPTIGVMYIAVVLIEMYVGEIEQYIITMSLLSEVIILAHIDELVFFIGTKVFTRKSGDTMS